MEPVTAGAAIGALVTLMGKWCVLPQSLRKTTTAALRPSQTHPVA